MYAKTAAVAAKTTTTTIDPAGCFYIYFRILIYIYVTIIIKEKETTTNLSVWVGAGEVVEGVSERLKGECDAVLFRLKMLEKRQSLKCFFLISCVCS